MSQASAPAPSSKGPTAGGVVASAAAPAASSSGHPHQAAGGAQAPRAAPSPPKAVRQTSATMSVQEKQLAGLLKRQVISSQHHEL